MHTRALLNPAPGRASLVLALSLFIGATALAEDVVFVGSGEILSEGDLIGGLFMGQSFDLAPTTSFEINPGGQIGSLPGSTAENPFDFGGSTINIHDRGLFSGILEPASFLSNTTMNLYQGSVAFTANLRGTQSVLNVEGGAVFLGSVGDGGMLNLSAGVIGSGYDVFGGASMHVSGGYVEGLLRVDSGSAFEITGGEIGINMAALTDTRVHISGGTIGDGFRTDGAELVRIDGGRIGQGMMFTDSVLGMRSGEIGDGMGILRSTVSMSGGRIGEGLNVGALGVVGISGGEIGDGMVVGSGISSFGSVVNITGGVIGDDVLVRQHGTMNIFGGTIGEGFRATIGAEINLFVQELSIDGVGVDLELDAPFLVTERGGELLEAILSDGSFLDFTLTNSTNAGGDHFENSTLLTVYRVPAPASGAILVLGAVFASRRRRGS